MVFNFLEKKVVDTAYWVGAIKRGADGSHMQLQPLVCFLTKAQM